MFYHCDQIGTSLMMTDEAGEVVWEATYRAWGEAREVIERASAVSGGEAVKNPLRFQGQFVDEETGLHYNRYRYYYPGTGRFVSKDPIGLAGGVNVYGYVRNPSQWVVPLGLSGTSPVQSATDVAGQALANGQSKGAASVPTTANGNIYTGVSGETVTPANKDMFGVLMGTPVDQQAKWHGGCAEIAAMSKALNAGEHLDGSSMQTVNIGRSGTGRGTPKSACCTCAFTMKHYNVKSN